MDVKRLLKQPPSDAAAQELGWSDSLRTSFNSLSESFTQSLSALKTAQEEKRAVAAQFKHTRDNPEALTALKQHMATASISVKCLEAELKAITDSANNLLSEHESSSRPKQPAQFVTPAKHLSTDLSFDWLLPSDERWVNYVNKSETGVSLYHQPAVHACIFQAFNYESLILVAFKSEEIVGGLPLTHINSRLFGRTLVSVPYFNYGGPLSQYEDVERRLLEKAKESLEKRDTEQLEVRTIRPGLAQANVSSKKVSMILPLPQDDDELEQQLGAKIRAQYKKALEVSPKIEFGGLSLLDDFYRVFAENMRDLGTPVYSKHWFRTLLKNADLKATLVVCYLNNKPSACGFLLGNNDMLEIPWASTLRKANKFNLNMWMYRHILRFAVQQRYQFFDFGRSTKDAPTFRFKKQWGAQEVPHFWYYYRSDGEEVGGANPDNPKYKLMIAVWKRLPVWVANTLGPMIVKQIP